MVRALRLTGAAVAAFAVAELFFPGGRSVLAPLSALLVVQVTLFSTLTAGVRRIAAVVTGVVVAVLFSEWAALSWWSLAIIVAGAIIVGQLLRLREHLPISAMLVLAVGGAEARAEARILETLIGAAVGVLYNLLLPGPVQSRTAGEAVEQMAQQMATLLRRMADELDDAITADRADDWLEEARALSRRVTRFEHILLEAEESRRLNVRALGTPDPGPALRSGLDALEHCTVVLRSLCRSLRDRARSAAQEEEEAYPPEVREVLAVLLHDLAEAVAAFGRLVREEAEGQAVEQAQRLAQALDAAAEARVRLTELLLVDRDDWQLHGVVLTAVQRMLREIDVEERLRQRAQVRQQWQALPPAVQAVDRLRATSRQVVRRPGRRRRWRRDPGEPR